MKQKIIIVCILSLFFLTFFSAIAFRGHVYYCCDNFNMTIPLKVFLVDTVKHFHQIPLWNPHLFSGIPFLADISIGLIDLRTLLYFFFTPFQALTIEILSHIIVLFAGMIWMLRKVFRLSWRASVFGAVAFTFSGMVIGMLHNVTVLRTTSFVPWVFGSIYLAVTRPTKSRMRWAILALAVQAIAGHPQITYFTILFSGFAILSETTIPFFKRCGIFLMIALIGLMITGIQTIPFFEFSLTSTRNFLDRSYAVSGAAPPWAIIRFIVPQFVGLSQNNTGMFLNGNREGYMGIIPLLLLLFLPWKKSIVRFLSVAGIVTLLLSFGDATPLHRVFSLLIPGFSKFRIPAFNLIFYSLSIAILSAFGVDRIGELSSRSKKLLTFSTVLFLIFGFLFLIFIYFIPGMLSELFLSLVPAKLVTKFGLPDGTALIGWMMDMAGNVFFVGGSIALFLRILSGKVLKRHASVVFLSMLCLDVLLFVRPMMRTIDESSVRSWIEEGRQTYAMAPSYDPIWDRMTVDPPAHSAPRIKPYGLSNEFEEERWQARILRQNVGLWFDASYVEGYGPIVPLWYQQYFDSKKLAPTGVVIPSPIVDNVSSVSATLMIRKDNETGTPSVVMLENTRPRFFLWDGETAKKEGVSVIENSPNKIILEVTTDEPTTLVALDTWFPGWNAFVGGASTPIIPLEGTFRSVTVPDGIHRVIFLYAPKSLLIGGVVSLAGFIFLLLIPGSVYQLLRRKEENDRDRVEKSKRQNRRQKRIRKPHAFYKKRKKVGQRKRRQRKK